MNQSTDARTARRDGGRDRACRRCVRRLRSRCRARHRRASGSCLAGAMVTTCPRPRATASKQTAKCAPPTPCLCERKGRAPSRRPPPPRVSPNSRIAVSSNARSSGRIGARACFAEVAEVAKVLAAGVIRGDLQAHLAGPSCGGAVTEAYARVGARGDKWRSVCGDRRHPVTDGQARARAEAQATRRGRTRRRWPPPSSRTDRSQWTARATPRPVLV